MANSSAFPVPFILSVGVPKGGDHKTWTAFNLASQLGLWGYDVVAIDTNAQHDLFSDWQDLAQSGLWPRFDVIVHDPFDNNDDQAPVLDLSDQRQRQFIIYDTSQFLQLRTTRWAWINCHALIFPVSPRMAQLGNYLTGIQLYQALPGDRGPIIVLPCSARVLRNSSVQRRFEDVLRHLRDLGCLVPETADGEIYTQGRMIPENEIMALQTNRWIYSESAFGGKTKALSDDFIEIVQMNLTWIRAQLEAIYGWFPDPKHEPLGLRDRKAMKAALRAEYAGRFGDQQAVA
jgi:hypothetical protein